MDKTHPTPGHSHLKAPDPLSLRPREAAQALGISERTLWSLTAAGGIPHFKLGRATLYPVRELTDWLTSQARAHQRQEADGTQGGVL